MRTRFVGLGVVVGLCLMAPAESNAQGLSIDHSAVGCIVAGKFPRFNACFTPASQLARARVYFRMEGTADWYYVEMASEAPCHSGFLPKPGKELVNSRLEYYVHSTDRAFAEGQTETFAAMIVENEAQCDDKLAVAPFAGKASVTVFPGMPAGFAAGGAIPAAAVAGIVGGGAAAAGTTVALTNNNDGTSSSSSTTATTQPPQTTQPPPSTSPGTTVPPTTTPSVNGPPALVLTVSPDPPTGTSPLDVTFNACDSSDPDGDDLRYSFQFGDGSSDGGLCRQTHRYTYQSFSLTQVDQTFQYNVCVTDPSGAESCGRGTVRVTAGAEACPSRLSVDLLSPPDEACYDTYSGYCQPYPLPLRASTRDGAFTVSYYFQETASMDIRRGLTRNGSGIALLGRSSNSANQYAVNRSPAELCEKLQAAGIYPFYSVSGNVWAVATCGGRQVESFRSSVSLGGLDCSPMGTFTAASHVAWTSDLAVPGGRGQTVTNGRFAHYPEAGRSTAVIAARRGENRFEAQLVAASGPGTWRFSFPVGSLEPGSLRVIAGNVEELGSDSVTFRLEGEPGERVVFTFRLPQ